MATAKKLPSGSWNCQVFSHFEENIQPDGTIKKKRIYKSFTCDDPTNKGKRKCEKMAADWAAEKEQHAAERLSLTVKEAIQKYCRDKRDVLSASTIRGYKTMARGKYNEINGIKLTDLTSEIVQKWIGGLTRKYSPKYVKNIHGLLSTVMDEYAPDVHLHVTLPQQIDPDLYVPSDEDIQALVDYFKENDPEMLIAVYLAAHGSLRRSEICGLRRSDISDGVIHVRHAVVVSDENKLVEKTTKSRAGQRNILMPDFFNELLPPKSDDKLISLTPSQITDHFRRSLKKIDVPKFRFHDLRHYTASIMHALGIPDQYIMERGGWGSDMTLKRIYRNTIDEYSKKFNKQLIDHFESMQDEMQDENGKTA